MEQVSITLTTLDNSCIPQTVQWCEANDAQRTLGSFIAPNGSISHQMEVLQDKLQEWQKCLSNLNSTNLLAKWLSNQTVFLKKVMYPLIGHRCDSDDLQPLQQPVDREVLHILGLNEHFPRDVLHPPLEFGGMGCVSIHGQHIIEKLILFVHHMHECGQMEATMRTSMSITQLECRSSRPFFSLPPEKWHHLVTKTWITHIWSSRQPNGIDIKFHVETFWVLNPVREHDLCIMDMAATMYDGESLPRINMCHIALQVTLLSDIYAANGRRILLGYYNGRPHEESGHHSQLHWPPVGELPASWWELWREFLIRWCGRALHIAVPLAKWFRDAECLTQCCFFQRGRMQHKDDFYEFLAVDF